MVWRILWLTNYELFIHEGPGWGLDCEAGWEDAMMSRTQARGCLNETERPLTSGSKQTPVVLHRDNGTLFWATAWCINSMFSTNVKLSTLCASLLMEHHVLFSNYRPLVSVFFIFIFFCLCFYFLFEPPSGEEASLPSLPYCHPAFGLTIFWLFILILGK